MASLFPALQKFSVKAGIAPAFRAAGIKAYAHARSVVGTLAPPSVNGVQVDAIQG